MPLENKDAFLWDLDSDYFLHHNPEANDHDRLRSRSRLSTADSTYDEEELTKEIGSLELEEVERHPLFERYHCNSSMEPHSALKLMVQSEHRKEAMRLRIRENRESEHRLWHSAIR